MVAASVHGALTGLGRAMVQRGLIPERDADSLQSQASSAGISFVEQLETGEIAVKAAQTGHLVLSTLHTNDAPTTLTRLINMGIAPFNIASSVILITAQRLARRLCKECKIPAEFRGRLCSERVSRQRISMAAGHRTMRWDAKTARVPVTRAGSASIRSCRYRRR